MGSAQVKKIAAVTGARSDYGILLPVLRAIAADPGLSLQLIVAGAHLSDTFGDTLGAIRADGFEVADRVDCLLANDAPAGIAASIGVGVIGYAHAFQRLAPDMLVLVGDRFEALSAAAAAVPFNLPIAHLHGGEVTEGAFDEQIRHAITKMSHLHFVTTPLCAERITQMGEEPWRITVAGAPALDNLHTLEWLSRETLEARLGMSLATPPVLVTFHPVTLEPDQAQVHVGELLAALDGIDRPVVITSPNADTANGAVRRAMTAWVAGRANAVFVANLGTQAYFSLMALSAVMLGNSSSGIIEAASLGLPVVNVGDRQGGRERGPNILDAPTERGAIGAALAQALAPAFRASVRSGRNIYGDGHAASRIIPVLRGTPVDRRLIVKRFHTAAVS